MRILTLLTILSISALAAGAFQLARESAPRRASTAAPRIQIVGASVMLRLQREGAPVYDFRKTGQTIPGAIRVTSKTSVQNSPQLVLIGGGNRVLRHAQQAIRQYPTTRVYIVPASFVAPYPDFESVKQIEPSAAYRLMKYYDARVFDFAEVEEFDYARVPGSTRIAWTSVLQNDFAEIQKVKNQPVLLICPVGSRSQIAAQELKTRGVRVLNVRGGMFAWQNAGLPLEGGST